MFDIDRELDDLRNIYVSPSRELLDVTKELIIKRSNELQSTKRERKNKNIIKITSIAALPVAASILFAVVIGLVTPKPVAYYSLDINPSLEMSVDSKGIVCRLDYDKDEWEDIEEYNLEGTSVEYAMSEVITLAQKDGYIESDENVLIGCFGEDEHNNISKNLILSYLDSNLKQDVNLMSVHSTMDSWKQAGRLNISAGLYALSEIADDVEISKDTSLDNLIIEVEYGEGKDIVTILAENAEPINYKAPNITYTVDGEYIIFNWDYIDYKKNNYDGYITYELVASNSSNSSSDLKVLDTYRFASWESQPVDYTLLMDDNRQYNYYGIIAVYDDSTRVVNERLIYIP